MTSNQFQKERVPGLPVTDESLIADLRRVSDLSGKAAVTQALYDLHGYFAYSTIIRRFGTWNVALRNAGIELSNRLNLPDEELFQNILMLWQHFGRQPRKRNLAIFPSMITESVYLRRFGSWSASIDAFIEFTNGNNPHGKPRLETVSIATRRAGRDPSLRLRFRVLQRDNFSCQACGASPAITYGVALHIDHIVPWSKGGETDMENLRTLCETCNRGKGNLNPC